MLSVFSLLPCGHLKENDLLALLCDVYCDFVPFPFGILGQMWYLIVSIPVPCCLSYFNSFLASGDFRCLLINICKQFGPRLGPTE